MVDCIFCSIVDGKIPAAKVYEDDYVLAFLSIGPIRKGHTLVIPKKHVDDLLDVDDDMMRKLSVSLRRVASKVMTGAGADGLNVCTNVHEAAGQEVSHMHWHVIPRSTDDELKSWKGGEYADGEIETWAAKVKDGNEESS